jgi:hypothetical protein
MFGFLAGVVIRGNMNTLAKNEQQCNLVGQNAKVGGNCAIWYNGSCIKGKVHKNGTCVHETDMVVLAFLVLAAICFILFIVGFFLHSKTNKFRFRKRCR